MEVLYNQTYTDIPYFTLYNCTDCTTSNPITTSGPPQVIYPPLLGSSGDDESDIRFIIYWAIFCITFPGICFALYKLTKTTPDKVLPVYLINLLVSDLIQVCSNPIQITLWQKIGKSATQVPWYIYLYGLQVNVLFMMCISAERYLMIVHVFFFRNIQNHRTLVTVSVIVWVLSAVLWVLSYFSYAMAAVLLVPYPLVMFFFGATWRALSKSSVPRTDQIRIMSTLALLLCIYTILFLPLITVLADPAFNYNNSSSSMYLMSGIVVAFNPLFDLLLYVFMRRDVEEDLRAILSCFKRRPEENSESV